MMSSIFLLLVAAHFGHSVLLPPEASYKILMLLPVSSESHRAIFIPLAKSLADRGHNVVIISNTEKTLTYPNVEEIYHGLPYFHPRNFNVFETRRKAAIFASSFDILPRIAREIYEVPQVKEIYDKRKEFDLIVLDNLFNEVMYGFLHGVTYITISPSGLDPKLSAVLGNPNHPAYVRAYVVSGVKSNVLERLTSFAWYIFRAIYWRHWTTVPRVEKELKDQFPDLPPLLDIERNQSLSLMNSHFSADMSLPLLANQIEIGCIHCHPGNRLPKDLEAWIEEAGSAGVVYFSLGSIARGDTIPVWLREIFIAAFGKLEQRVLWKYEGELQNLPENVKTSKWLPQQDILAHPNVKVFISHGGGLSTLEAYYHATPTLLLPLFGDQTKNAAIIVEEGRGLSMVLEEVTEEIILNSLLEILRNPMYKENMLAVSKCLVDQPQTPTDRAVFWTEYVIRHKGAPHLRSPAADLSWIQFLLLDVLALLILTLCMATAILWILTNVIRGKIRGR